MTKSKSNTRLYLLIVLGVVLLVAVAYTLSLVGILSVKVAMPSPRDQSNEVAEDIILPPKPTPTPTSLKQGKETYIYSWGEGTTVPKMGTVTIDPHDPKVGETQHVSVTFTHPTPIQSVSMQLFSDNTSTTYPMTLSSGSATNGTWVGSWSIQDTVLYRYDLRVLVKSNLGETPYDIVLRGSKP